MRELGVVCLFDLTGINPEVLQAILSGLFSIEPDLLIARLVLASAICQVFEADVSICFLCMRMQRTGRNSIVDSQVLTESKLAGAVT